MIEQTPIQIIFAIGFGAGFLFGVWFLDRLYRNAFKEFRDEMHKQYLSLINGERKNE